jgi:hypothetical protein
MVNIFSAKIVAKTPYNLIDLILKWVIILLPVLLLILFFAQKGVILFYPDTKNYLTIADNLHNGTFLSNPDLAIKTIYAPIFPVLLSILKTVFADVKIGFMFLSTISLLLANMVLYEFVKDVKPLLTKHLLGIILVFFVQHLHVHVFMLSESILLPLFYLYFYIQFVKNENDNWQTILMLNILIIACFFVKYSSLIVLLFAGLYDLFVRKKKFRILIFTYLLPALLIGSWMLFCLQNSGNITGDGFGNSETLLTIGIHVFTFCSYFILPFSFCFIVLAGIFFIKNYTWIYAIAFYLALLIYFDFNGRIALDERLHIPIYLPLVLTLKDLNSVFKSHKYNLVFQSVLVLSSAYTLIRYFKNYYFWLNF